MMRSAAFAALVGLQVVSPPQRDLAHPQMSADDRFALCAREVFGKPVLRDRWRPWPDASIPCPASKDAIRAALVRVHQRLLEFDTFVFTVAERRLGPALNPIVEYLQLHWERMELAEPIGWWGAPQPPPWPAEELQRVGREMLRVARPVPLLTPSDGDRAGVATVYRPVSIDVHQIAPGRERVIGVLWNDERRMGGEARLVYGERRDGALELLWDSPLFRAEHLLLGYNDMDRDGVEEILISDGLEGASLVVFTIAGDELSRQGWCRPDVGVLPVSHPWDANVCPIIAEDIQIDGEVSGPKQLLVTNPYEWYGGRPRTFRYRLIDGRYRR
jgi:hypothetical protein